MIKKITAVIIDDIELARISLRADLEDYYPAIDIIGEAEGVVEGAKLLKHANPDIIFLDIEMKDGSGFDLLDIIPNIDSNVIFVTGNDEFAIKAFQYSAVDYLLKPVDSELLVKAIDKVNSQNSFSKEQVSLVKDALINKKLLNRVALHTSDQILIAELKDIVRLESMGNYTQFYFIDGSKILITKTLKLYDDMFSENGFLRVHQSHLINLNQVKAYIKTEGGYITMKDDSIVPVSVRKKSTVIEMLG